MKIRVTGGSSYEKEQDGIVVESRIYSPPPVETPEGKVWNGVLGKFLDESEANYPFEVDENDTVFGEGHLAQWGEGDELAAALEGEEEPKGKKSDKTAQDSLYEALVEDELPKDKTLAEHDKERHPDGFNPETDSCKFREEMKKETETDRADEISPESAPKEDGGEEGGQKKPLVSPEEDKAYMEAVKKKDYSTARRLLYDLAHRMGFYKYKLYHGTPRVDEGYDDFGYVYRNRTFNVFNTKNQRSTSPKDVFWVSPSEAVAKSYAQETPYGGQRGLVIPLFVRIDNPFVYDAKNSDWYELPDGGTINDLAAKAKNSGYDSIVIENVRDIGRGGYYEDDDGVLRVALSDGTTDRDAYKTSIAFFNPSQAKSAEIVERDDNGEIIPLSRRFDDGDDIRGDVSSGKSGTTENNGEEFGDEFFSDVYPDRSQSYSSEFGTDDGEEKAQAEEAYKANFTKDGKYKPPLEGGRFSKEILEKAREGHNGQESEVWDESSRANAEAAGRVLSNILGGVSFVLANKPYGGSNGDSRKSFGGIFTGTSADYANESRQGGVGDGPSLLYVDTGTGLQKFGYGLYGTPFRRYAESYSKREFDGSHIFTNKKDGRKLPLMNLISMGAVNPDGSPGTSKDWIPEDDGKHSYVYEQTFFSDREDDDRSHLMTDGEPIGIEKAMWIRKELDKVGNPDASEVSSMELESMTPREVQEEIGKLYNGNERDISEFLVRAGIDGIDIPNYDFVLSFRDDNIRVDHKWVDGEQRYFRNSAGKVVGEYNRATNQITLYPGAKIKDVVHEYAHGLWQFAEQEAKDGSGNLLDNLHRIADSAPSAVKEAVYKNYADEKNPNVLLEECFTHELARRSEQNERFARAVKTASGKQWYKRAWGVIKDTWKGLATKLGFNKADTSKMDGMSAHDAAEYILSQMAQGKRFGSVNPDDTPDGWKKSDTRKSFIGEKGAANLGIGHLDEAKKMTEDGVDRTEVWKKTGWWKDRDGKWKVEMHDSEMLDGIVSEVAANKDELRLFDIAVAMQEKTAGKKLVDLLVAYPELSNLKIEEVVDLPDGAYGAYYPNKNKLQILAERGKKAKRETKYLAHELQHVIQRLENFGQGGNPKEEDYLLLKGEVESRNVETRLRMDDEEITNIPPWETEDIPENDQIIR